MMGKIRGSRRTTANLGGHRSQPQTKTSTIVLDTLTNKHQVHQY